MRPIVVLASLFSMVAGAADVRWEFSTPADLATPRCFLAPKVEDGVFRGHTLWDPYISMRVPEEGLDVRDLPHLTVRMYSSADADVLDVYYKCSDGLWGLGRTLPIKQGWGVYRADLRKAGWTEGGMQDAARQWGGVSKRIVSFRIDPGNQGDRWVVVDSISLSAQPTGELGFLPDARGIARNVIVNAPAESTAGQPLRVELSCEAEPPEGLTRLTAVLRLLSGGNPAYAYQGVVDVTDGRATVVHEFPFSRYHYGGEYVVDAHFLELDGPDDSRRTVTVRNPLVGTRKPPSTKVADHRGEPALYINGEATPLITYLEHGGGAPRLHREMAPTGITVFTDWFGASVNGDLGHKAPGEYDYTNYDDYFAQVLEAVPEALFLPHVPVVAPLWWQKLHPEECCLFSDGRRGPSSLFSELWRQEMAEDLRRLIEHLQNAPYADRILGYIFFAGHTAEWQMWATWKPYADDYSKPALTEFRRWLQREYGTTAALRKAWRAPAVTFETAAIPPVERRTAPGPFVRDPATDQAVIDYNQFSSDGVADSIIHFAAATKDAVTRDQIVGTYYGYLAAHGARQPECGHNGLAAVLRCPDIDFLMSPPMYAQRGLGETSTFMSATESVKLHGKLWLDESDLRSYLSRPDAGYGRTKTPEGSVATCWREFANVLTRKAAVSWFDMTGGWFSGEPMLNAYTQQMKIARKAFLNRKRFVADVALFVDERSYANCRMSVLLQKQVRDTIASMPRAGIMWDFYLMSDLADPELPDYKLYALLNAVELEARTQQVLMTKAARNNASLLYMYAPAIVEAGRLRPEALAEITGMQVRLAESGTAAYKLVPGALPSSIVEPDALLGVDVDLAPRPVVEDADAETLARFADGAGVCLARKAVGSVHVYYCSSVSMPHGLWREIARAAGAFVYCSSGDSVYTDDHYLALHAASDGDKTVALSRPARVVDPVTGRCIAESTTEIRREMKQGETLFVELEEQDSPKKD